jgi:hypothetical protein
MIPAFAGHGTHVAGLAAANAANADAALLEGVCRRCGLAVAKVVRHVCLPAQGGGAQVFPQLNPTATQAAIEFLTSFGAQVINMSFGGNLQPNDFCGANPNDPWCLAITFASANDVVLVGASGNNRADVQFPARDARSMAIGGVDQALAFWDESPGGFQTCPFGQSNSECGSNFTLTTGLRRQEVTTPARTVRSTFYRGLSWRDEIGCGDTFGGGAANDGVGLCTGTSMSTPMASGLAGLLRSINPLVVAGDPENALVYGVRDVIAQSTDRVLAGQGWSNQLGYGRPNARTAASLMLGKVRGEIVTNRVTPLFTLYSATATDFANVATSQNAMALIRFASASYTTTTAPLGGLTPGYSAFPSEVGTSPPPPRANAYVLTSEFSPGVGLPTPVPLFWLDRARSWPVGCVQGQSGCNTANRDFLLVSTTADVQSAVSDGFGLRGIQGYIYPRCAPEPSCTPPGTERLYRQCSVSEDDCALFLESQRTAFQSVGYTSIYPSGSDPVLGYAYPSVDTDGDGLVNGMELVIGTNVSDADADDDGMLDGAEFPQAAVSFNDPCVGPNVTCTRIASAIFC